MKIKLLKTVFLTATILFFTGSAFSQDEMETYTKKGDAMPDFSVKMIGGKEFKLSELKGKIVFINFWATWCGPCLQEMPLIETKIWQKNKESKKFAMVLIARDHTEEEIIPFIAKRKFTFPVATDPDRSVFKLFGNQGIPRSYIVDQNGKILFQSVGYFKDEFSKMIEIIDKELSESDKKK